MAGKLSKDQKREKAKRDALKKNRQRQHEQNRTYKKFDQLDELIQKAIIGVAETGAIETALLSVGDVLSVSASQEKSAFQWEGWRSVRERTSRLVALMQDDVTGDCFALDGRIFHACESFTWVDTTHLSLNVALVSRWSPLEVFQRMAPELDPVPIEGIYFFGFEVGSDAVHVAIASNSIGTQTEYFLVTAKGWRMVPEAKWHGVVWPFLTDAYKANSMIHGADVAFDGAKRIRELQTANGNTSEGAKGDDAPLNAESRQLIDKLLHRVYIEGELLLDASFKRADERLQGEYEIGWADGMAAGKDQTNELSKALDTLRGENARLNRVVEAYSKNPDTSSHLRTVPNAIAVPLHVRMSSLLGVARSCNG